MFSSSSRTEIGISAYTHSAGRISPSSSCRALVKILPEAARYSHTVQLLAPQVRLKIVSQSVLGLLDLNLKIWDSP